MPTPADIRAQYVLQVRAEGKSELDAVSQGFEQAKAKLAALENGLVAGTKSAAEFRDEFPALNKAVSDWGRLFSQVTKEIAAPGIAYEKAAQEVIEASEKVNAALSKDAAEETAAAQRATDAKVKGWAEEMDQHDAVTNQEIADEIALAQATEKAERERAAAVEKATADVMAASAKVNAALARDRAEEVKATEKATQQQVAAWVREMDEHERLLQEDLAEEARLAAQRDQIRRVRQGEEAHGDTSVRQRAGINREQERLNFLIAEGADLEAKATTVVTASARAHQDRSFEVQKGATGFTQYIDVTQAASKATGKHRETLDESTRAARASSYALLNVAHAVQDAQYGFGAVLNNIPLVVQAFGGGGGLAGAIMIAGVGINVFSGHLKQVAQDMGLTKDPTDKAAEAIFGFKEQVALVRDPTEVAMGSIAGLKKIIGEIADKPYKVEIDYQMIHLATEQMEELQKRVAAFGSAVGEQDELQGRVAQSVHRVVAEEAGGTDDKTGAQNLLNLIKLTKQAEGPDAYIAHHADFGKIVEARQKLEALKSIKPTSLAEASAQSNMMRDAEATLAEITEKITDAVDESTKARIGDAMLGRTGGIDYIQAFMRARPGVFAAGGQLKGRGGQMVPVQPVSPIFGQALQESRPEVLKALQDEEEQERLDEQGRRDRAARRGVQKQVDQKEKERFEKWSQGETQESQNTLDAFNKNRADSVQQAILASKDIEDKARDQGRLLTKQERARIAALKRQVQQNKGEAKLGLEVEKHAVAEQILGEFGGNISPEQALKSAGVQQASRKKGENPVLAMQRALIAANEYMAENAATMMQMNGFSQQLQMMFEAARMNIQQLQMMTQAGRAQLRRIPMGRPMPGRTIGG